jgi:hypothetical protein
MGNQIDVRLAREASRFYADPLGFVQCMYPWGQPGLLEHHYGPDVWQREFLIQLGKEVEKRKFDGHTPVAPIRMSIASGHAGTFQQLSTRTWAQISQWTKLCITGRWFIVTTDQLYFNNARDGWFVSAQSCKEENSESFAGQHAADSTSFYIFDEASAVPDRIFEVAEGGLTDGEPMIFLFGNPTRNSGKFHRVTFGSERDRWLHRSVDSRTSKLTNQQQLQEWISDYGEDSDFVRVRVRGECPRSGTCQLINHDMVAACRRFHAEGFSGLPKILSCDPARYGDDRSVIAVRQGRQARILAKLRGVDLVELAGRIIEFIDEEQPDAVVVDADGLGAGVVDTLRHRNYGSRLHEFHGGQRPDDPNAYYNKRAECWSLMRDWLKAGAEIPDDGELEVDLCSPEYGFSNKNQVQLERKEDMKSRGLASPDLGDALAVTFGLRVGTRARQSSPKDWVFSYPTSNAWMAG